MTGLSVTGNGVRPATPRIWFLDRRRSLWRCLFCWLLFGCTLLPGAFAAETRISSITADGQQARPSGEVTLAELTSDRFRTSSPLVKSHDDVRPGFVYQINGTFYVNSTPIRFWGVNVGWGGSWKQGGDTHKSLTHDDVDRFVLRLKELGFNAVRIFPPSSFFFGDLRNGKDSDYQKGDGSLIDKFDYFLFRLKKERMYAYMSLNLFGPSDKEMHSLFQGPPNEFGAWKIASRQYGWPNVIDKGFLVDKTWEYIKLQNILRVLRHYNKWTEKHNYEDEVFALYELNNEVRFPERILTGELESRISGKKSSGMPAYFEEQYQSLWNGYLLRKYGAESNLPDGYLTGGESLSAGSVELAPAQGETGYAPLRAHDFAQFVLGHYISAYNKLYDAIRATAPPGVGASVIPINVDSISGSGDSIANAFTTARGGFNSGNGYQHHHYSLRRGARDEFYPYVSMLTLPPEPYGISPDEYHQNNPNLEIGRIRGQPFVMYEGMTMTPNIFKAEYFVEQAVLGSWQNFGGYFFYQYSLKAHADDLMSYREPLKYSSDDEWATSQGFGRDEVMLSIAWAAGAAFRNFAITPASNPTKFIFGRDAIFDPEWRGHGTGADDWPKTARTAIKYGAELDFDPEGAFTKRIVGPTQDGDFTDAVVPGQGEIRWDWPNGRLIVDTPRAKIYAGIFPNDRRIEFRDGVTVENLSRPWGYFVLASDTKDPIASSDRVFMSLVQTSDNTGMKINPARLSNDHQTHFGWKRALVDAGSLPVIVNRISADVKLPERPGRLLVKRDFDLKQIGSTEDAAKKLSVSADEPVFQWLLLAGEEVNN